MEKSILKIELDGSQLPQMRHFYSEIEQKMQFPDHFGRNLDALLDCLCDLAHLEAAEIVVQIQHPERFLEKARRGSRESVWEIFDEAALPENRYDSVVFRVEKVVDMA